jgi:SAM-dependent methyltransferase
MMQQFKSLLKKTALPLFLSLRGLWYKGSQKHCPCCKGNFSKWLPLGYNKRPAQCPRCRSNERDRTLWLFLEKNEGFLFKGMKILHVAPEAIFYQRFRKDPSVNYTPADKFIEGYESTYPKDTIYVDITSMPQIPDNTYDLILCSHVLECLYEDRQAMREIRRVLRDNGKAILQVPVDYDREVTFEDPSITDPLEREKIFGNKWNLRWYGKDYQQRLEEEGFRTGFVSIQSMFTDAEISRFGLGAKDEVQLVYKH